MSEPASVLRLKRKPSFLGNHPHRPLSANQLQAPYWSTGMVANLLGCASRTVTKMCDSGRLECHRLPGTYHRRISREALAAFCRREKLKEALAVLSTAAATLLAVCLDAATLARLTPLLPAGLSMIPSDNLLAVGEMLAVRPPRHVLIDAGRLGRMETALLLDRLARLDPVPRVGIIAPADGCRQDYLGMPAVAVAFGSADPAALLRSVLEG